MLLPTRHHPICACNVNTRLGKTRQTISFSLKFSDASKSDVKVVVELKDNGEPDGRPTITEEWQPVSVGVGVGVGVEVGEWVWKWVSGCGSG